jgi:hypothetical protein
MHYNRQIPVEDIGKLAVPSFGIISRIHEHLHGTTVAPTTIKTYLELRENELDSELRDMGVVDGLNDSKHNGKYHRKTMTDLIDRIVVYS